MKDFIFNDISCKFTYSELYVGLELKYLTAIQIIDLIKKKRSCDDIERSHLDYYFELEKSIFDFRKLLISDSKRKDKFKLYINTDNFIINNRKSVKIWEFIVLKKLVSENYKNIELLVNLVYNEFSTFHFPDEWNDRVMIKFSSKDPGALNETVLKNIVAFLEEYESYFRNRIFD